MLAERPAADLDGAAPPEPPPRHLLAGGCVGVDGRAALLRAALQGAWWMGAVPLAGRVAAAGPRAARHGAAPDPSRTGRRRLLRAARPVRDAGESLVLFAQGTILGIETDFSRGAFALARALALPILPVAVTGGHRVWEHPFSPRLRRGQRVSVRALPPVSTERVRGTDPEILRRQLRRALKRAALDGTMAPPRRFCPERNGWWDGYAYRIDPDFPALARRWRERRGA